MALLIPYVGATGDMVYIQLNPLGLATVWNGSAFEAYNASHWAMYAIPAPESGVSGRYYATWPSTLSEGWYQATAYQRAGGSPVTTDVMLGSDALYFSPGSTPIPTSIVTAGEWIVPSSDSQSPACGALTTRPGDLVVFTFNFGGLPQINSGAILSTCVITASPSGLTLTDQGFSERRGFATFAGGTADTDYVVTANVSLNDGTALTPTGTLRVRT